MVFVLLRTRLALADARRRLHSASVALLGSAPLCLPPLPTGTPALDRALPDGGLPQASLVALRGGPASGRTGLALTCIAEVQRQGGVAAFVDADHTLRAERVSAAGVDGARLGVLRPRSGEDAGLACGRLLRLARPALLVVDGLSCLPSRAELAAPMGQAPRRAHAEMRRELVRTLGQAAASAGTSVLLIEGLHDDRSHSTNRACRAVLTLDHGVISGADSTAHTL